MDNNHNSEQDVEIAEMKTDISWIKHKLSTFERQIFNELPHQIDRIKTGIIVGFLSVIAAQIIINILK